MYVYAALVFLIQLPTATSLPASLRAADARSVIQTAVVRVRVIDNRPDAVSPTRDLEFRYAGDQVLRVDRGDADGVIVRDEHGAPSKFASQSPRHLLMYQGAVWQRDEADIEVTIEDMPLDVLGLFDLRKLGSDPVAFDRDWLADARDRGAAVEFLEREDGGLLRIEAKVPTGKFTWWLDPQRGHRVVKSEVQLGERVIASRRYTLARIDGIWFPVRVEEFEGPVDTQKPRLIVEITDAEFNRPTHPARLTPIDIGVESGMLIMPSSLHSSLRSWDGQEAIDSTEYAERLRAGEVANSPKVQAELDRRLAAYRRRLEERDAPPSGASPASAPTTSPRPIELTQWEHFTFDFIRQHGLDEAQTQRALFILDECQQRGRRLVATAHARMARHKDAASPERTAIERDLQKQLDTIFEQALKPRLHRLLTTKQAATSRPS